MPIGKDVTCGMREKVLKELAAIGFAKVTDFMAVEGGDSGYLPCYRPENREIPGHRPGCHGYQDPGADPGGASAQ